MVALHVKQPNISFFIINWARGFQAISGDNKFSYTSSFVYEICYSRYAICFRKHQIISVQGGYSYNFCSLRLKCFLFNPDFLSKDCQRIAQNEVTNTSTNTVFLQSNFFIWTGHGFCSKCKNKLRARIQGFVFFLKSALHGKSCKSLFS